MAALIAAGGNHDAHRILHHACLEGVEPAADHFQSSCRSLRSGPPEHRVEMTPSTRFARSGQARPVKEMPHLEIAVPGFTAALVRWMMDSTTAVRSRVGGKRRGGTPIVLAFAIWRPYIPSIMKNIALVPGVLGFRSLFGVHYFNGVADHLNAVFAGQVHTIDFTTDSLGTIEDRARKLGAQIKSNFGTEPVHIFAHSMGGLDARFLVAQHLTPEAEQVKSITAIGTPHKGSPIATILDRFNPLESLLNWIPGRLKKKLNAVHELAETEATEFNDKCPDQPSVVYHEIAGISRGGKKPTSTFFRPFFKIVFERRGLNDGLVPVTSATRPDRDPLDRWEADHADMVGHDLNRGPTGKPDFDYLAKYRWLVETVVLNPKK